MAGTKMSKEILNDTLIFICTLLNNANLKDWFICYGTLLGIIREDGCIDNDDDVDIIISEEHYDIVKDLLLKNNIELNHDYGINNSRNILKTKVKMIDNKVKYASIDLYMSRPDKDCSVYDKWTKILVKDCYDDNDKKTFEYKVWNDLIVYVPNNYIEKLRNLYGNDWTIKKNKKMSNKLREI